MTKTKAHLDREIANIVGSDVRINSEAIEAGFTKFRTSENRYPRAQKKTNHGIYEMFARPSDFLVNYWPDIIDKAGAMQIGPYERLGAYPSIEQAHAAIEIHARGLNH